MQNDNVEKLKMMSKNMLSENIEKIATIFPNVLVEASDGKKIDFDILKQELSKDIVDGVRERYHLDFPGKKEAIVEANRPITKTLRPLKEKSVDFDNTKNIYIEGDNLEALKILQESYFNKIKCIYIDPPYNTGKDFVYNDDFSKKSDEEKISQGIIDEDKNYLISNETVNNEVKGKYHSDWIKMMYSRIRLSRNLLSRNGILFISIDERELHNLEKICEEIFGINNKIGIFVVENNPKGRKNSKYISVTNEFCIVFAKDYNEGDFLKTIPKTADDMEEDESGIFVRRSGKRVLMGENSLNKIVTNFKSEKHYSAYIKEKEIIFKQEMKIDEIDDKLVKKGYKRFITYLNNMYVENTYTKSKLKELFDNNALDIRDDKIYEKHFSDMMQIKSVLVNDEYDAVVNNEKMHWQMDLKTTSAKQDLIKLMGGEYFSFPKNINFIENLLKLVLNKNDIVLDFFSGSATTAHAVMKLNAEDGGNRQFILVQLPEATDENSEAYKAGYKNICEIGEERIKRASKKILEENKKERNIIDVLEDKEDKKLDIGFRVFKVDESNMKDVFYEPDKIQQGQIDSFITNIKEDRTKEDLLIQVMLDMGLTLDLKIEEKKIEEKIIFIVSDKELVACFDEKIDKKLIDEIIKIKPIKVVLRESGFEKDEDKINYIQSLKNAIKEIDIRII